MPHPFIRQWYSPFDYGWRLCSYETKDNYDFLSHRLHEFKDGNADAIDAWSTWSREYLDQVTGKYNISYVARALGKKELVANPLKPLHKLGEAISYHLGVEYAPQIFLKHRETKDLKVLNRAQRFAELDGVFYLDEDQLPDLDYKSILLIDDIHTSGATTSTMMEVLKERFTNINCYLFALAKTHAGTNTEKTFNAYKQFDDRYEVNE